MSAAEAEVVGVGTAHSAVGDFCRRMRENGVPPVEELGGIAIGRNGIIARTMASRY